jgi:aspartate racemase
MIGILGGMGTMAGINLAHMLAAEAVKRGAVSDSDFPKFMLYNIPAEGMDECGVNDEAKILPQIEEGRYRLVNAGCAILIIACNSIHALTHPMSKIPMARQINLVEEACIQVPKGTRTIGVIGSSYTKDTGLYTARLTEMGINVVNTNHEEQTKLDNAIKAVMTSLPPKDKFYADIAYVCNGMKNREAKTIIVGCTELSAFFNPVENPVGIIDAGYAAVCKALDIAEAITE